jgi:hypothetical protein
MPEPDYCQYGCGMLVILNENTGRFHELASHNPHNCAKKEQPKKKTSTRHEDITKSNVPEDWPYQGICTCGHWHGKPYNGTYFPCVHIEEGRKCTCTRFEFPSANFPRRKASTIICPMPDCSHNCIAKIKGETANEEHLLPLHTQFQRHMQDGHSVIVSEPFIRKLENLIINYSNNSKIHYHDPFIHVSMDELFIKEWKPYEPIK